MIDPKFIKKDTQTEQTAKATTTAPPTFDPIAAMTAAKLQPGLIAEQPPDVITIDRIPVCRLGSFSALIGKAKARKGFFAGALTAAATSGSCTVDGIRGNFAGGKTKVVYFDTEQGSYWGQIAYNRIIKAVGIDEPTNLHYYNLQQYNPAERLQIIDTAIQSTPDLLFVVIDGIRDLISSINDEAEATNMTSQILKWCAVYQIHVVVVLHQNKNDMNARGHIGTEIINKAESVFSVAKEKDTSLSSVKLEFCRGREFNPFTFGIDDNGLPYLTETSAEAVTPKSDKRAQVFNDILAGKGIVSHSWLKSRYMEATGLKDRQTTSHITAALNAGILCRDDDTGHYSLNIQKTDEEDYPF